MSKKRDRERAEKQATNFKNNWSGISETLIDILHISEVINEAKEIIEEKANPTEGEEPKKIEYFKFNEKYITRYHKAKIQK